MIDTWIITYININILDLHKTDSGIEGCYHKIKPHHFLHNPVSNSENVFEKNLSSDSLFSNSQVWFLVFHKVGPLPVISRVYIIYIYISIHDVRRGPPCHFFFVGDAYLVGSWRWLGVKVTCPNHHWPTFHENTHRIQVWYVNILIHIICLHLP